MEASSPADASRLDPWTVGALAVVAYCIGNVVHEGLGHGGACVLVGGTPQELNAIFFECSIEGLRPAARRWLAAGGSIANLGVAVPAWLALQRLPRDGGRGRADVALAPAQQREAPGGDRMGASLAQRPRGGSGGGTPAGPRLRAHPVPGRGRRARLRRASRQTGCTVRRFVFPGSFRGTPATIAIRSPGAASPRLRTSRRARDMTASVERTRGTRWVSTPQTSASW